MVDLTLSHVDKIENVISFLKLTHYFSFHISTRPFIQNFRNQNHFQTRFQKEYFQVKFRFNFTSTRG